MADAPNQFPALSSTRWSLIARAGDLDPEQRSRAVEELLHKYSPALRAHLVLRKRLQPDRADDVLQEFIVRKILERDLFGSADPAKGRFRTLLLTALDRFLIDQLRHNRARIAPASLDDVPWEEPGSFGGADVFETAWARNVLTMALREMREQCFRADQGAIWTVFQARLLDPVVTDSPPVSYEVLAVRLNFQSPKQAANAIVTAKRKFEQVVREIVAEYVAEGESIDAEIGVLQQTLATAGSLDLREFVPCQESPNAEANLVSGWSDAENRRLASLLNHAGVPTPIWQASDLRGLWRECLATPLANLLPAESDADEPAAGTATVAELLGDPRAEPETLRSLQRVAKHCRTIETGPIPCRVAESIYFACIAAAMVYGQPRTTRLNDAAILAGLDRQLACDWLDPQTQGLFQCARAKLIGEEV